MGGFSLALVYEVEWSTGGGPDRFGGRVVVAVGGEGHQQQACTNEQGPAGRSLEGKPGTATDHRAANL